MPGYFDEDTLRKLNEGVAAVPRKAQEITQAFLLRAYISDAAKEYAHHGVARRIYTLARCISQIYAHIPPEFDGIPEREVRIDTTIFAQAFVFNAFGVLDNLAFVWVNERNVRGRNGRPLPNGRIGLTADKEQVRLSFSARMQALLVERDPWFAYLESFRHSLGHRIPLYIPPYTVTNADLFQYNALDVSMNQALRDGDIGEHARLQAAQVAVTFFRPWMKHSFEDATPPMAFHPQVLADFATVEEICMKILEELDTPGP